MHVLRAINTTSSFIDKEFLFYLFVFEELQKKKEKKKLAIVFMIAYHSCQVW